MTVFCLRLNFELERECRALTHARAKQGCRVRVDGGVSGHKRRGSRTKAKK